jgi:excisionase family DNA binding protein
MGELLNVGEISQYLGVPKSHVYALVEAREIPFYRIGRLLRFRKADIDSWLNKKRVEPVADEMAKNILARSRRVPYNPKSGRPEDLGKEVSDA